MQEKSYLATLLRGRCPRCRQGDIFTFQVSKLSKFNVMNQSCPHCGVQLEPEPGFYQGAMYVGYGFTIACLLIVSAVLYVFGNPSEWVYISVSIGLMILVAPLNYRYSRILYLHLFGGIRFDPAYMK